MPKTFPTYVQGVASAFSIVCSLRISFIVNVIVSLSMG